MDEQKSITTKISFLSMLRRNIIIIVLIALLCAVIGGVFSVVFVKPTYTASANVALKISLQSKAYDKVSSSETTNDSTLAKMYLPTVTNIISSPNVSNEADKEYQKICEETKVQPNGSIEASALVSTYSDKSLIFSISYTDVDVKTADAKLAVLLNKASEVLSTNDYIPADRIELVQLQSEFVHSASNSLIRFIVLGLVGGIVIAVIYLSLRYLLDNTVKDKDELEEITESNLIAYIDDIQS